MVEPHAEIPVEITELDVHDDVALREYWEVEQAAMRGHRSRPLLRSYHVLTMLRDPNPYFRHVLLAARADGRIVGTADLGCSVGDNLHLADLEISVHPARQRLGIGRALYDAASRRLLADGRTTVVGEAHVPVGTQPEAAAAYAFASALCLSSVHVEDHLLLDLPATPPDIPMADSWEVITWGRRCPDELRSAYCRMRTQMENDVPRGEVDYEPHVFDEERLRVGEERIARGYDQVVAAARRTADGAFGGYSVVLVPHGEPEALQDDTLVMPEHRGHRLGLAMKRATLAVLSREHPELSAIHTWTSVDNAAMQRTNLGFGYRAVERMHEMQGTIQSPAAQQEARGWSPA
jgi:GNAT superfamily N-acetyltransferase